MCRFCSQSMTETGFCGHYKTHELSLVPPAWCGTQLSTWLPLVVTQLSLCFFSRLGLFANIQIALQQQITFSNQWGERCLFWWSFPVLPLPLFSASFFRPKLSLLVPSSITFPSASSSRHHSCLFQTSRKTLQLTHSYEESAVGFTEPLTFFCQYPRLLGQAQL